MSMNMRPFSCIYLYWILTIIYSLVLMNCEVVAMFLSLLAWLGVVWVLPFYCSDFVLVSGGVWCVVCALRPRLERRGPQSAESVFCAILFDLTSSFIFEQVF